jgi:hypothetical protein
LRRTEVTTETATVTVQTVNLVGVSVISNVSTPPMTSPAPTTLVISTVGVGLNSSSTIRMSGGVANTTSPTGVVGSSGGGSSLGYVSPTPWGTYGSPSGEERGKSGYSSQPLTYDQPSAGNDGDGENGYGSSTSNGGEEGDGGAGSSSYGDSGEYEGDVETGHWEFGSAPDSEDSGSESEEQSGGSSFLDWLLEILR